jgi:PAS domain S-box-containing protein
MADQDVQKALEELSRDLQESKARLEEAQRVAHVGHWEWDLETGVVVWSDETYRIFGLNPQERPMDLATVQSMVHPEDRDSLYGGVDKDLVAGVRPDAEFRIVRPSGEVRTVHALTSKRWSFVPGDAKRDAAGQPYKLFGTVQDITGRKQAEEALQRTQAHFREGQRLARMGSWTSDGSCCQWSEELFQIYGLDPINGVPTTEQFLTIIHPQDRASMADAIKSMLERQDGCDVTTRIVQPDGELRYVRCVGVPVTDQGIFKGFLGTAMDVTQHELLTQELRREQAYLSEAQSLANLGSWACNLFTRKIFHSSDQNARLYGFDPKEGAIPFDRFYNTILEEDEPALTAKLESVIHAGADYDVEFRIRRTDGAIRFLRAIGHHAPTQEIGEYIGVTIDITERKRAEEERERLRQLEADLAHINRINMMGELTAALAHEIKQPIAAAITSANACVRWLERNPPDIERARAAAARIEHDGNRAADVIDRLRSFYKKGSPPNRETVDVREIIREMSALFRTEAIRHSIKIRFELDEDRPHIFADRVQLQQVFMNLILNAVEAMKDSGGELRISSRLTPDHQLVVSISDTGVGLPAENAEQIFDAFHTTKPQGTGMGLAITRSIVEAHGGRVWATANPEAGATFHFTLPTKGEGRP